ncbi:RelA/SpoT family protein [Xiashengella succiniciproducens]|jgi:guanosine-3',5'-bis(diphosphate) 3'-pyrophosphohydrolase|uniref:RelA/SpoT family protein n=1 Tax=Xiashengella succiniciproducens TaxID=2949635 RepID=A0A9J6ZL94_9BACT|nr:RelA/SpoT family protein [Alkaliflexus sp. Ai-910]URW78620.1 RelA/SpoT family protein [Alkaliflexus sp. Ai-910]HHU01146.1 bifunctional (p)ppGpp synthetase/guanosine-3',5'-bis(diphosphate) 3'-pyrophosphohydrolase [Bacteroidales bacterium]
MAAILESIPISDRVEILKCYRNLLRASSSILTWKDIKQIREAIELSMQKTGFERHPSGKLVLVHSLEVARVTVEEMGLGKTSLICALLYELVRNSETTIEEIEKRFGKVEANIMDGLIKVYDLYRTSSSIQSENFRKLLLMFAKDIRVVLIIIADRLITMRSLGKHSLEEQLSISAEVSYLYAPMAHRLGLYTIKSELEDLVMKYTERDIYKFIAKKLNETKRERDRYIKEFIEPLKEELNKHDLKFEIKGRTKTINSIYNKMKKQNVEFEQVYDLFAIRVILDSELKNEKADCWKVYSIVADMYQPNPRRMRDWLTVPKSNGYESLHTTVLGPQNKWVEVQIRTKRMDEIAEKGLAAHWKYKGIRGESGLDEWLTSVREILENPELNAVDLIDDFKLNLYDDEVFVFTPKGDLIRMPKGATVLDFAFNIHSEIGKKCVGARVNSKNVQIKYQLQNGDHIEILTSSTQAPKQDWLNIVATARAKTKLKQALREQLYKEAEIGRETLIRRLKNWKLELNDQLIGQLVKNFRYKTVHDMFRDIALEKLDVVAIREFIQAQQKKESTEAATPGVRSAENFVAAAKEETETADGEVLLIDKNLTNVDYKLAKCCNPIFGDDIFGFVGVSGGIKIHRTTCPNATELRNKYAYRIVKAQWTGEAGSGNYLAAIKVVGEDDIGIISNISSIISKETRVKLRSITVESNEGLFEGAVSVFVSNSLILNSLIKKIRAIKGVLSVSRIDG